MEASGHSLLYKTYEKANVCCHCQKLLAGLFFQGYHCTCKCLVTFKKYFCKHGKCDAEHILFCKKPSTSNIVRCAEKFSNFLEYRKFFDAAIQYTLITVVCSMRKKFPSFVYNDE